MTMQEATGYCKRCKERVLIRRIITPKANHVLHFLITLCTCGLWALVWMLAGMQGGKKQSWRCSKCGGRVRKSWFG